MVLYKVIIIVAIVMSNLVVCVQDEVFWSDWRKHSILKVNRRRSSVLNDSNVELVTDGLTTPMDLCVHHSLKQPRCKNVTVIAFCMRHSRGEMYIGHSRLWVCPAPHSYTTARTWM